MHSPLLSDLVVLLLVSIAVLYASQLAKLPAIVAFLVSGVLLGPHGFGLVQGVEEVEQLAEIVVILLLFTIGLEFSLTRLRSNDDGPIWPSSALTLEAVEGTSYWVAVDGYDGAAGAVTLNWLQGTGAL